MLNLSMMIMIVMITVLEGFCDPIIMSEDGQSFHKLEVNKNTSKNQEVCRLCHMVDFTKIHEGDQQWAKAKPALTIEIKNLDESQGEPDTFSIACLSCHDGSSGSNVLNAPLSPCGLKNSGPVAPNGANHPVFLKYPAHKADLHGESMPLNGEWADASKVGDLLREEQIVCISCHTPHHSSETSYLRTTMRGSALCIGCHKK